jgi:hypothetical protein
MTWVAIGTSAAIGAGTAAVTGGDTDDILKGAVLGGITGGVTGGMTPGAEGLNPELLNASPELLNTMAPEAITAFTPDAATLTSPELLNVTPDATSGILQAQPQQLQFANTGATSDIAQYGQDKSILDARDRFIDAQSVSLNDPNLVPSGTTTSAINVPVEAGPYQFPSAEGIPTAQGPQTYYDPAFKGHMESYSDAPSSLSKGFDSALNFMNNNKFLTGTLAVTGLSAMGAFDPNQAQMPDNKYKGSLSGYRMSPNFQPSRATPNVYTPRYAAEGGIMMAAGGTYDDEPIGDVMGMASGGIASYARGRRVDSQAQLNEYMKMMEGEAPKEAPAPAYVGTTGIIPLDDINTRGKDALTASMVRMSGVNSRANYSPYQNMKRPSSISGINLSAPGVKKESVSSSDDEREAAAGGIMQADRYNMGGYASGSVPRLLKGPGDGMSDDIPASIDNRQPARLADGEFVIPADVVSHLGNGSTEAGAKKLHKMMTDLRKDRTGNPKQGKQIVAEKYIPKKYKKA